MERNDSPVGRPSTAGESREGRGFMAKGMSKRKKFVLCFDGTGNKFSGTDSDSNILKIYRMLDRNDPDQKHYYQPGIGTYVTSGSLSHTSRLAKLKSWYIKSKDQAVGTSFAEHVMGGYRFLMRYYQPGDDIYLFGFSRGAYTARFLAEMLDHVGILSAGNEEMCRFAWKAFQRWQQRQERTEKEKQEKQEMLDYLMAFRETFSRPVSRPIQFMGLFDTVNSVPTFENAWMSRSKFPYTARSTAKVIRHAVSIDERRAKFRQDLVGEKRVKTEETHTHRRHLHDLLHQDEKTEQDKKEEAKKVSRPDPAHQTRYKATKRNKSANRLRIPGENFRRHSEVEGIMRLSPNLRAADARSQQSSAVQREDYCDSSDEEEEDDGKQDIQEVWFSGCHADIGGGWPLAKGEEAPLSHVPLLWMLKNAEQAGLRFDEEKLRRLNCSPDEGFAYPKPRQGANDIPNINIQDASPAAEDVPDLKLDNTPMDRELNFSTNYQANTDGPVVPVAVAMNDTDTSDTHATINGMNPSTKENEQANLGTESRFHKALHFAATKGKAHDVLQMNNGVGWASVMSWNMMEYMPFKRMDLQPDGSWKSISWPLPKGEVRDVPDDVVIHNSVLKRMLADKNYRPGNVIIGGGGRGVRKASEEWGMGKWKVLRDEGCPIGEVYVRDGIPIRDTEDGPKTATFKDDEGEKVAERSAGMANGLTKGAEQGMTNGTTGRNNAPI